MEVPKGRLEYVGRFCRTREGHIEHKGNPADTTRHRTVERACLVCATGKQQCMEPGESLSGGSANNLLAQ